MALRAGRVDGQRQQVVAESILAGPTVGCGGTRQLGQRGFDCRLVPTCPQLFEFGQLLGTHPAVLDLEDLDLLILFDLVLVDPDHRLGAGVDAGLSPRGGFFDAQLRNTVVDGLGHAAASATSAMCARARCAS